MNSSTPDLLTAEYRLDPEPFWTIYQMRGDDGYDRIEAARFQRWIAVPSWGRDGWDLGSWPYVLIYHRATPEGFELAENVEGDVTYCRYPTRDLRDAATNQLAFWHEARGRGLGRRRRFACRSASPLWPVLAGTVRRVEQRERVAATSPAHPQPKMAFRMGPTRGRTVSTRIQPRARCAEGRSHHDQRLHGSDCLRACLGRSAPGNPKRSQHFDLLVAGCGNAPSLAREDCGCCCLSIDWV